MLGPKKYVTDASETPAIAATSRCVSRSAPLLASVASAASRIMRAVLFDGGTADRVANRLGEKDFVTTRDQVDLLPV